MNKLFLLLVVVSLLGCRTEFETVNCSGINSSSFYVLEDFIPNCENIQDNKMILSVYIAADLIANRIEWRYDGEVIESDNIEVYGTGIKRGSITLYFDQCTISKQFSSDLSNSSLDTGISGFCWRDSRYFEGGKANIFDPTDYGSGPIVIDLLHGETLELIARDTTITNDNTSTYSFSNLDEGLYVLKFYEREMDNVFLWLDKSESPILSDKDSDVNELGFTDPFFLKACQSLENINAGFKVCFPQDDDCINSEECSYFVEKDDVFITTSFVACTDDIPTANITIATPGQNHFDLQILVEGDDFGSAFGPTILGKQVIDLVDSVTITFTAGNCVFSDVFEIDYSQLVTAAISGRVWHDIGILDDRLDSEDELLRGIVVELIDANNLEVLSSATTSSLGVYQMAASPGNYYLRFVNEDDDLEFVNKESDGNTISQANQTGLTDLFVVDNCDVLSISAGLREK